MRPAEKRRMQKRQARNTRKKKAHGGSPRNLADRARQAWNRGRLAEVEQLIQRGLDAIWYDRKRYPVVQER